MRDIGAVILDAKLLSPVIHYNFADTAGNRLIALQVRRLR
jgi:hypothetical protein